MCLLARILGPCLFCSKPFELLAQLLNLRGRVHQLGSALRPSHPRKGEHCRR